MSGVADAFARCRAQDRAAFIPYVMAGDPSLHALADTLAAIHDGGADVIEVGFPYSDPLADGPTIQAAAQRSIAAGTTFDGVLRVAASLDRARIAVPLIAFTYYNPMFVRGLERTARDLRGAGFASAIVPDLPPDEAGPALEAFARAGLGLTFLVAPTTPLERLPAIAARSADFVYIVSSMGVTGMRADAGETAADLVARVRPYTGKPLAVGFGVSDPEQAKTIARHADGVIVGSALVQRIAAARESGGFDAVQTWCASIRAALGRVPSTSAG